MELFFICWMVTATPDISQSREPFVLTLDHKVPNIKPVNKKIIFKEN